MRRLMREVVTPAHRDPLRTFRGTCFLLALVLFGAAAVVVSLFD